MSEKKKDDHGSHHDDGITPGKLFAWLAFGAGLGVCLFLTFSGVGLANFGEGMATFGIGWSIGKTALASILFFTWAFAGAMILLFSNNSSSGSGHH